LTEVNAINLIIEKIVAGTAQRRPAFIETSQLAPFLAMAEPIRVAVVDPYPIFRDAVVQTIARTDGLALAGEGSSIADARRLARESGADIVTFDISTSEGGIDASKPICKSGSDCKLIVLTALDDAMRVSHAIAAGARGYILKGVTGQELVAAIKLVHAGQPYITAELASRMLVNAGTAPSQPAWQTKLSYREQQILENISKGLTNREIAAVLQLTDGTIKHYLTALFKKLDVNNRLQAIQAAKSLRPS
jgi:DNA-binding NarL/FixJ family response regulator